MADLPPPTPDATPATPTTPRATGEAIPAERRLSRPPSDRYRRSAPVVIVERPAFVRAALLGALVGLGTAALSAIFWAVLSITAGLLAIAILGGWLIGVAVRTGAWSGRPHRPSRSPVALAVALGIFTWAGTLLLAWLISMAILPGSTRSFLERLDAQPFLDWVSPQLEPLDYVRLVLLMLIPAWSARTPALEQVAAAPADAEGPTAG
ncbi:MAG: hypothetical protein U0869_11555 [Chloroflexota bacterium]